MPKGVFTTKSAYFVAQSFSDIYGDVPVGSETLAEIKFLWKALWRAKVPGKVKICIWRGCLNALPTRVNLKVKKVVMDDCCVICGTVPKTVKHIMLPTPTLVQHGFLVRWVYILCNKKMWDYTIGWQEWFRCCPRKALSYSLC